MDWETAWEITRQTFGYTNHTLLPEALESWPLALFGRVLPRHLEIIYEINRALPRRGAAPLSGRRRPRARACRSSTKPASATCAWRIWPASAATPSTASPRCTRELLKRDVLRDFYELWPEKFTNMTNGVTPRRWIALANPGPGAADHRARSATTGCAISTSLRELEPLAEDAAFRERLASRSSTRNKDALAADHPQTRPASRSIRDSLFDVQVKRIHEYKRQHLNVLHVITLYHRLKRDPPPTCRRARSSSAARPRPATAWPS